MIYGVLNKLYNIIFHKKKTIQDYKKLNNTTLKIESNTFLNDKIYNGL